MTSRGSRWVRSRRFVAMVAMAVVGIAAPSSAQADSSRRVKDGPRTARSSMVAAPVTARDESESAQRLQAQRSRLSAQRLIERADEAFKQRRYTHAEGLYRRAFALDQGASQALVMAGVAAYNAGEPEAAKQDLTRALSRPLSTEDRALAKTYLDILAVSETPGSAWQPRFRVAFSGGFDGNVRGTAPGGVDASIAGGQAQGAGFGSVSVGAGLEKAWEAIEAGFGYEFFQVGYPGADLASYNYQEHAANLRLSRAGRHLLNWELSARGDLSFTGLGTALRAFQNSASGEGELIVGYNQPLRLRVAVGGMAVETLDPSLAFLSGKRLEARLVPEWNLASWRLSMPLRWRRDWMGTMRGAAIEIDPIDCPGCATSSVTPYSNQAWAVGARIMGPLAWRLRPSASARVERRIYLDDQHDEFTDGGGGRERLNSQRRVDDRVTAGAALAATLSAVWSATLRYDYSQSDSAFVGTTVERDPSRSYRKHVVSLELEASWM